MVALPLGFGQFYGQAATSAHAGAAPEATPNQLLIGFQSGTSAAEREAIVAARGGRIVQWFASSDTALVNLSVGRATSGTVRAFAVDTAVRSVEPNARIYPALVPDDPQYASDTAAAFEQIGAPAAWATTTGSRDVIVGVVDSGIDYTHPDLAANIWSAPTGWNLQGCGAGSHGYRLDPSGSGCDPIDEYGHGTHVAGTIGAVGDNGSGIAGVNWQVSLMALRVFDAAGYGDTAGALAAIDYAVQAKGRGEPVRILNISWTTPTYVRALYNQISAANAADILVVAGAGNAGQDNAAVPVYPANFGTHVGTDQFPAALPNVIAVAATNAAGDGLLNVPGANPGERIASNYSATRVDLAAPGEGLYSTFPGDDYDRLSGTSMATPFVAGAAALLLAALPLSTTSPTTLNAFELRTRLSSCGTAVSALADKTRSGNRLDIARAIGGVGCAVPVPSYRLDLTPKEAGSATVTASPSPGPYPYGTTVELTAIPAEGYRFTNWLVDGEPAGTAPALVLPMTGPRMVRAVALPQGIAPQIEELTPAVAGMGALPLTLTIDGRGFLPDATVFWQTGASAEASDPQLDTTHISSQRLRVTIPANLLAEPAAVQLRVANPTAGDDPPSAPAAITFAVRTGQSIAFGPATSLPGATSYGAGPFVVSLTASSGLPVSTTTNDTCTIAPIGGGGGAYSVTIVRAGRCVITAKQEGDTVFAPAETVTRSFIVYKRAQSITFDALPERTLGDPPFTSMAQATSTLAVRFSVEGACSLNGQTLSLVGTGTCKVTASQHGNGNFDAAADVVRQFQVSAPTPTPTRTPTQVPPTATPTIVPTATPAPVRYTLTLTPGGNGTITPNRPPGAMEAGAVVTLTANPGAGQLFVGWWVDGALRSYANPVRLTMDRDHAVVAEFAAIPAFADVTAGTTAAAAIEALAARGVIKGCDQDAGLFCPADPTLRAQMAALIARAMDWDHFDLGNSFPDQGMVDDDLWRNVGVLASYGVARGYKGENGGAYFDPTGGVLAGQTISFITRAMVKQGYWQMQGDDPARYPNVPAASGHREDLATYAHYVSGGIPDFPDARGNIVGWDQPSSRAWFARALWAALRSHFGITTIP